VNTGTFKSQSGDAPTMRKWKVCIKKTKFWNVTGRFKLISFSALPSSLFVWLAPAQKVFNTPKWQGKSQGGPIWTFYSSNDSSRWGEEGTHSAIVRRGLVREIWQLEYTRNAPQADFFLPLPLVYEETR
jgi:hypothetical protein